MFFGFNKPTESEFQNHTCPCSQEGLLSKPFGLWLILMLSKPEFEVFLYFFLIPDGSHHKVSQGRAPPNELALQAIVCWRIFCWSGLNKAFLCECSTDVDNLEALKRPKRPFVLARLQRACSQTCQILRSFLDTFCLGQIQCAEFSIQNFQCEAIIPKAKGLWTLNFALNERNEPPGQVVCFLWSNVKQDERIQLSWSNVCVRRLPVCEFEAMSKIKQDVQQDLLQDLQGWQGGKLSHITDWSLVEFIHRCMACLHECHAYSMHSRLSRVTITCVLKNRAKLEGRRKDGAEAIKEEKNDKQYWK